MIGAEQEGYAERSLYQFIHVPDFVVGTCSQTAAGGRVGFVGASGYLSISTTASETNPQEVLGRLLRRGCHDAFDDRTLLN